MAGQSGAVGYDGVDDDPKRIRLKVRRGRSQLAARPSERIVPKLAKTGDDYSSGKSP
ncbi:MAG: hypothetical protein AB1646_07085 [Thermodesulfobacteriota bacterium]